MTPEEVVRREYGSSRNFMTPRVLAYGWIIEGVIAYELSEGEGFDRGPTYGVTVVRLHADGTTERMSDVSQAVWSRRDAYGLVERLKEVLV